jgi:hypothetical protein
MREQIDNFKNFLLKESKSVNFTENQKRLREYIKILKENYDLGVIKDEGGNYNKFDIIIRYFIIIHNFLYLEDRYFDVVKLSGKELNKYLKLSKLESLEDVINKFNELYDTNSKVRFGVETFDSIEEIRLLLNDLRMKDFTNKIYKSFNELSKSKGVMSKKHRKNIMREVNRLIRTEVKDFDNLSQADKIGTQDEYIDKVCKEHGWTLNDFYFADSKELDSLLVDF